jgi:hypothetical protein
MYTHCPKCNLKYQIEPSFFYGAMYVSYGLTVAFSVATFVIGILLGAGIIYSGIAILVMLILSYPITYRLSRIIYINIFINYKTEKDT